MSLPLRAAVGLAAAIIVTIAATGQAQAAAYRYWTYWTDADGGWSFATAGPASLIPDDGSVDGWRFAVTTTAGSVEQQPRGAADFEEICGSTPAADGMKRVALVIDPGDPSDAPEGQAPGQIVTTCVVAEPDATGYQLLRSVSQVRVEGGLVCGIEGYPTGECAPVVDAPTPAANVTTSSPTSASPARSPVGDASAMDTTNDGPDDSGGSTPWPLIGVVALLVIVAGVLVLRRRRG